MKKKNTLRVCFFTSHPARAGSGSERLMYDTAAALIARGHDARVYVMNSHLGSNPPFYEGQIPVLPFEKKGEEFFRKITGGNDLIFPSTAIMRFHPWIGSADIWHFNNIHGHFVSIPLLGLWSWTKKIVISPVDQYLTTGHCPYAIECNKNLNGCGNCPRLNEPWPGISRDSTHFLWLVKRSFLRLSRLNMFFHTHFLASYYQQSIKNDGFPVIHYGVDILRYRPMKKRECAQSLGIEEPKGFTIGLLHSFILDPRKGFLPVIEQLGSLAERFPERIALLVVGHNSEEVRKVIPAGLSLITLPFLKDPRDFARALNLCDVLLYPTVAENLSLTCLYSLACGVPVISYDVGGQGEAISHGKNGFLVKINDGRGILGALTRLAEDPEFHRRMSEGARNTAEKQFDFDRYIDELLVYYQSIL
ncbi:MAG: glycosyltransferase [Deltaproteobacteria bacterium]|nr:glycosyltransferase [Deltaproteobacteria bacterium]